MTIPAQKLASVIPGVVAIGGAALALSGLILTSDTSVPIGTVSQFSTAAAVASFFGSASAEAGLAAIYFAGYDGSTAKPGVLLFSQYATASVSAYLRGGSLAAMTLAQLQAVTAGTMSVTVDGSVKTSSSINLSGATSFSNAATIMTTAFSTGPVITYDAQRAAFVATSGTTGATSTITFATGAIATALNMTQATGAVTSQGAAASTPAAAMNAIVAKALNWASFMTVFEPVTADKLSFATWASQQSDRFAYMAWDTDINAAVSGNSTAFGPQVLALGLSDTVALSADPAMAATLGVTMQSLVRPLAALAMSYMASIDFSRTNGRTTFAFRSQGGIVAGVGDTNIADILKANGYNYYGNYATAQLSYNFMQPGQISGRFAWLDSFANEVWMNAKFQNALLAYLASAGSIPYNVDGYGAIETVLQSPISDALRFGAIRANTVLSGSQITSVNSSAGKTIDTVLASRGWYLNVGEPSSTVKAARGTPQITLYYCDGGSIQALSMSSLLVQ